MKKKKCIKLGVTLIFVFILCTLLSRGLYNSTIANVTVSNVQTYTMDHSMQMVARLYAVKEKPILVKEGMIVTELYVTEGEQVEKGDALLRFDVEKVKEQVEEYKNEIAVIELQIEEAKETEAAQQKSKQIEQTYAKKNKVQIEKKYEENLSKVKEEYENAKAEYEAYKKNEIVEQEELKRLKEEVDAKQKEYKELKTMKKTELTEAEKEMKLSEIQDATSTNAEQLLLQKNSLIKKKGKLEKILNKKGKVIAESSGTITEINIGVGEMTAETAVMLISDKKKGYKASIPIDKSMEQYIDIESKVSVTGTKNGEKIQSEHAKISTIKSNEDELEAVLLIKDKKFEIGMNVTIEIESDSIAYDTCIPIQAVHQEGADTYFIYTCERKDGILGEEVSVNKIPIEVVDKDSAYVAVEDGSLSTELEIILTSDQTIDKGSTVRIRGESYEE